MNRPASIMTVNDGTNPFSSNLHNTYERNLENLPSQSLVCRSYSLCKGTFITASGTESLSSSPSLLCDHDSAAKDDDNIIIRFTIYPSHNLPNEESNNDHKMIKMDPCLYIRATDFIHSLSTLPSSLPSTETATTNNNNNNNNNKRVNTLEPEYYFIQPHPMIHLDNDTNQKFIALTSIPSSLPSSSEEQKEHLSSPILSNITDLLLDNGIDLITNNRHYWSYHYQSSLLIPEQPIDENNNTSYFPKIQFHYASSASPSKIYLSSKIIFTKTQIEALKDDVLLWNGDHPKSSNSTTNNTNTTKSIPSFQSILQSNTNSNLIAIRALGIIQMKPKEVYDLMLDSDRVRDYNLYSLGRDDIWIHDYSKDDETGSSSGISDDIMSHDNDEDNDCRNQIDNDDNFTSHNRITKVCHGCNKPPLVRKPIPYMTLFHGTEVNIRNGDQYDCNKGYVLATRSAKQVDSNGVMKDSKSYSSKIMLGCTLLLPIHCDEGNYNTDGMTLFINANLVKSPMPYYITKKIGLSSAVNYVNWLRSVSSGNK